MNRAIIQRQPFTKVTFGSFIMPWFKAQPPLDTIELPWKENQPDISCIPAGIYICKPYSSARHPDTWEVTNVPGRTAVHFDIANYACDIFEGDKIVHPCELLGCIAIGMGKDEKVPMVKNSEHALNFLRTMIGIKNAFELEIKNAPGT